MKQKQVIIIGGGASGMVAAIVVAREGAAVTLIEQKERLGKKILSTGNGRCNFTKAHMTEDCFHGDDKTVVKHVLSQFTHEDTLRFFSDLGVLYKERQGYFYPVSDQATTISDVLIMEIERLEVSVFTGEKVVDVRKNNSEFLVKTTNQKFVGDTVILATGGKAAPALGSDGSGYDMARSFGHHLSPVVPALVQLHAKSSVFKKVAGVRTQAKVTLYVNGQNVAEDTGELQLTDYGISGIPVFQVSRYAAKGLYSKQEVTAEIDFLPEMTEEQFSDFFAMRMHTQGRKKAADFLVGIFHQKLSSMFLSIAKISPDVPMNEVDDKQLHILRQLCKHFKVDICKTNDFAQAQICAGGVKTNEINSNTLESLRVNGLYITGELLDVDGICGGYNLQWAWATGYIAGKNAAKGN